MSYLHGRRERRRFRVFISYETNDIGFSRRVKHSMEARGATVFLAEDTIRPGKSLTEEIIRELRACELFVVIWGEKTETSGWVRDEIDCAVSLEKRVLPVVLSAADQLPPRLKDIKYIRAFEGLEAGVEKLIGEVDLSFNEKRERIDANLARADAVALTALSTLGALAIARSTKN